MMDEKLKRRLQAINSALGIEEDTLAQMHKDPMAPFKLLGAAGSGIDSITGAPTRAAIGSAITEGDPMQAFANQFGADPQTAPSFGMVEDALLDPTNLVGMAGKAPMMLGNELGAIGDLSKLNPEQLKMLQSLIIRHGADGGLMSKILATTEEFGDKMPTYFKANEMQKHPIPNYFSEAKKGIIGSPEPTWWQDPFKWMDDKYKVGKDLLQKQTGPVTINTSSDLIGKNDYIEAIPQGSKVNMYLNPLGDGTGPSWRDVPAGFEAYPSNKRLMSAVNALNDAGISVEPKNRLVKKSKAAIDTYDTLQAGHFSNLMKQSKNTDFEKRLSALLGEDAIEIPTGKPTPEMIRQWFEKNKGLKVIK